MYVDSPQQVPAASGVFRPEQVGASEAGRAIHMFTTGKAHGPLRILILGCQHGDERVVSRAILDSVEARVADGGLHLAAIPCVNPDGSARRTRGNASGVDLNRDHQLLTTSEVRAVHGVVRSWQPHVVLDVHTYPSRREWLLREGLVHCHDVFLDLATNPNSRGDRSETVEAAFWDEVPRRLAAAGLLADRFIVRSGSNRVRHSTIDVVDARNALALRYGCFTVVVEARGPSRSGSVSAGDTRRSLEIAIGELLAWASDRSRELLASLPRNHRVAVLRPRYRATGHPREIPMLHERTGEVRPTALPGRYTPIVERQDELSVPRAYAVPQDLRAVIEVLERHGLKHRDGARHGSSPIQLLRIVAAKPPSRRGRASRGVEVEIVRDQRNPVGFRVFDCAGLAGRTLAVFLEPRSKFGLHRYDLGLKLTPGTEYPVVRVL